MSGILLEVRYPNTSVSNVTSINKFQIQFPITDEGSGVAFDIPDSIDPY